MFKVKQSILPKHMCSTLVGSVFLLMISANYAENIAHAEVSTQKQLIAMEGEEIEVTASVEHTPLGSRTVYAKTRISPQRNTVNANAEQPQQSKPVTSRQQVVMTPTQATEKALPHTAAKQAMWVEEPITHMPKQVVEVEGTTSNIDNGLRLTPVEKPVRLPLEAKASKQAKPKIKSPEELMIDKLEFKQANMLDVARALADISGLNFVATEEAAKKSVTVFLQNISVKNALDTITKNSGVWYRQDKDSNSFRIMSTEEYQRDLVVYREDTTRVFNLLHPNPVIVATAVRDLYGPRVIMSYGSDYDDFNTGQFNGNGGGGQNGNRNAGGGNQGNNRGGNAGRGSPGGTGLSNGQAGLRNTMTTGTNNRNNQGMGNNGFQGGNNMVLNEAITGTSGNGAITEKFTADQLEKIENALQFDENGNLVASDVIRGISRAQQPIYVTISRQQNIMIVRTSDSAAVKEIENLVKAMDRPTPQILLEMKILEVEVGDAYTQLFSFGALSKNGKSSAIGRESADAGVGKFVYQFVDDLIAVKLELLQQNNQAKTVSSPVLLASNNRTARLFVGEERLLIRGATLTDPVLGNNGQVVTPGRITYETEIRNVGNTLNITPKINANGTVTLGIFQDTSNVQVGAVEFPPLISTNGQIFNFNVDSVQTANIEGVVVAQDGLTVAIGGLIRSSVSKDESKIPLLGDLPIIGNVFKDRKEVTRRSELILLITPHIITAPNESDDVTRDAVEPLTSQVW
jgi:general secretion pathway protein D